VSGDDLAALLYAAGAHPDPFVRCACAARALELQGRPVTANAVVRATSGVDRELAADTADRLTERKSDGAYPHASRIRVGAAVTEGLLDLGPYGLHRPAPPAA
jgi:hypothetical protein